MDDEGQGLWDLGAAGADGDGLGLEDDGGLRLSGFRTLGALVEHMLGRG